MRYAHEGEKGKAHTFGRVGVGRASRCALALEVPDQSRAVLADVAEVDRATALLQEEKAVKALEQESAGLMDRAPVETHEYKCRG